MGEMTRMHPWGTDCCNCFLGRSARYYPRRWCRCWPGDKARMPIQVGEAAINPVPRKMIHETAEEVLHDSNQKRDKDCHFCTRR